MRTHPPEIPDELLDPDAVHKVIRRLKRAGHTAYLVGGCVRDSLLGIRPKDFDVATSAHPNQVKETFRNCRLIGRRFRLAHVYFRGGKLIEVSTFRANPLDELKNDLPKDLLIRHDNVFGSEEEDARRRDFTINGLFYDPDKGEVIDHVGGKQDLAARLIRTIGDPDVRMREDPVRILRAIRFAAKCGLSIEPVTLSAMKAHAGEIPRCAPPRVLEELLKLVRSGASKRCFELMEEVGILRVLLPPVAEQVRLAPETLPRHLRALAALDAHVRADEVPSDAVLLATLLSPLPRQNAPRGPIAKAPPGEANAEAAPQVPAEAVGAVEVVPPVEDSDELDPELLSLERELDAPDDDEDEDDAEGEEGDEEGEAEEDDEAEGESPASDLASAPAPGPASPAEPAAAAPEPHAAEGSPAQPAQPAQGASEVLAALEQTHGGTGRSRAPSFSLGGGTHDAWELPHEVVPAEVVLTELVRSARLPRRAAERTRLVLAMQPLLSGERRRRRAPANLVRQSIFPEALAVFELNVAATGQGADQLARWQGLFNALETIEPEAPAREDEAESQGDKKGGERRRRRRGGRRRRKGQPHA